MITEKENRVQDGIRIGYYEDWMFDQVIGMFVAQYGLGPEQQRTSFRQFYEATFQLSQGIRLVALDGQTVCGFQSYFYWPYCYQGTSLRTFQSGNSLVSDRYRGRQIFARLLNFLPEANTSDRPEIDFLMGFPVEMSYGSFIRNKWANPLDLVWYTKPIHPFAVVRAYQPERSDWHFETVGEEVKAFYEEGQITLSKGVEFAKWRRASSRDAEPQYLYWHYYDANGTIRFELKPQRRGWVNELVLGDIVRSSPDPSLLRAGLKNLIRVAKEHFFLTILSIALNEQSADRSLLSAIKACGFFKLKNRIHFIVKPLGDGLPECSDPRRWYLLRSDIDTW